HVARLLAVAGRPSTRVVDVVSSDHREGVGGRQAKRGGDEKDGLLRRQITDQSHDGGGRGIAEGVVSVIASESAAERAVSDQAEPDGRQRRLDEPGGSAVERLGGEKQGAI